jgi:hypothetical protein
MRPKPQDSARENDNPGYRDDNPKRGDNVTSNKENSLIEVGKDAAYARSQRTTANRVKGVRHDQRGALDHVTNGILLRQDLREAAV